MQSEREREGERASGRVGVRLVIICFRVSDPDNGGGGRGRTGRAVDGGRRDGGRQEGESCFCSGAGGGGGVNECM